MKRGDKPGLAEVQRRSARRHFAQVRNIPSAAANVIAAVLQPVILVSSPVASVMNTVVALERLDRPGDFAKKDQLIRFFLIRYSRAFGSSE